MKSVALLLPTIAHAPTTVPIASTTATQPETILRSSLCKSLKTIQDRCCLRVGYWWVARRKRDMFTVVFHRLLI